jgi:hypothetical protein
VAALSGGPPVASLAGPMKIGPDQGGETKRPVWCRRAGVRPLRFPAMSSPSSTDPRGLSATVVAGRVTIIAIAT